MFGGVWSYVVGAGLAVAFVVGVYQTGYNAAMRKAQVATITAERDAARADLATTKRAADTAAAQAIDLAAAADTNEQRIKELSDALAKAGGSNGACRLGSDFGGRLRSIK